MTIITIVLTIIGLCAFEVVSSIDNAVINAEVISTMSEKGKKWFMLYGILFAVLVVRGLLPWLIVWITNPSLGFIGALTATFSSNPDIVESIKGSTPVLMLGGGVFLVFLFFHWLFTEDKAFGLPNEKFFMKNGVWFYAVVSVLLVGIVAFATKFNPMLGLSAVIGSSAFFITDGFKKNAGANEDKLINNAGGVSDFSKILYLEIIDATFSIDGVLGAFAFTMSIPLILIGNGLGAFAVRYLTLGSVEKIKKYVYLKNGAMYSVFCLGIIMVMEGFKIEVPDFVSPLLTIFIITFFFIKSKIYAESH